MAIDKNTKTMLDPTSDGNNFGISDTFSYKQSGPNPTNYVECKASVGNWNNIMTIQGKVTSTGASGQENFDLANGGAGLGKPLGQDGRAN
jgi:hypothetical protein